MTGRSHTMSSDSMKMGRRNSLAKLRAERIRIRNPSVSRHFFVGVRQFAPYRYAK
jgi:hypothetical protein